ncbi:MAG TPA: cation-transporting P-type ATPase [Pseudobacteroides sp.]|uniref:cation-transporting P-type ATPase n=1 Tax=Pseudobacteroides sp. TaxID=1968840 RepID=UPI002F946649
MTNLQNVFMLKDGQVEKTLQTSKDKGLTDEEAAARLKKYGTNELARAKRESLWLLFLRQFHQPLIYILLLAAIVTLVMKEQIDSMVIFGVILLNGVIGFVQEAKALKALESLAGSIETEASVIRSGRKIKISSKQLVPGDIVFIQSGDKVPADLRLFQTNQLKIQEAALTGESVPVEKNSKAIGENVILGDRVNMAFASTFVTFGQGYGIVVFTGTNTEVGKISNLLKETVRMETPLIKKIAGFSKLLMYIIGILAVVTFAVGVFRGEGWLDMFKAAIALAVGAIPEGLPAALAATLAIGVSRMAKKNSITRKLPVVETLGSTTVICSDKTGTLTENRMTVKKIWTEKGYYDVSGQGYDKDGSILANGNKVNLDDDQSLLECLRCGVFCNDSSINFKEGGSEIQGDPTEISLLVCSAKAGIDNDLLIRSNPRLEVLPFESERQYMAVLIKTENGENRIYMKGSLEKLSKISNTGGNVTKAYDIIASDGLRVLAFAYKVTSNNKIVEEDLKEGFTFLGLQGMIDPPRAEAITAIKKCHDAGIIVKMITGDHAVTALAIAKQLGIAPTGKDSKVYTGIELEKLSSEELKGVAASNNVFARVTPEQKLRLVEALQALGHVVAMTGDGVNDAPALKKADIGIAMGITGTEVAKDSADMILMDDNFATIENAVEEGRGVFDNLTKFITWTLPTNLGEGLVILLAIFLGITLPITPTQILWINMTTAVFLGLMLAFEPKEPGIMQKKPRSPSQPILTKELIVKIIIVSIILLAASFLMFDHAIRNGSSIEAARTTAVTVFIVIEAAYLINSRSLHAGLIKIGFFSNKFIFLGILTMAVLQWAFIYLPFMNSAFKTEPLSGDVWIKIVAIGIGTFIVMEVEKVVSKLFISKKQ